MMHGWGVGGYGMGIWMMVSWVIMAAVIVFALYGLIALIKRSESGRSGERTGAPLEYLKERLAKGEIAQDEYERIKEELLK